MPNNKHILFDSDFFVGWMLAGDSHHKAVLKSMSAIQENSLLPITTSWVVAETATFLSHRKSQALASEFLQKIEDISFPIVHMTESLQAAAQKIFSSQTKKGTSMTDCGNVAVMQQLDISEIASFDKAYSKQFGLKLLSVK